MQNIRDYLNLVQLRYEHKLEYQVEYDSQMKDLQMPRLVMEPFVENIFAHAYGPKHKIVHVRVSGVIHDGRWYVTIEDDGQGISGQKLQQMRDHIQESCQQIMAGKRRKREYGIGVEIPLCVCICITETLSGLELILREQNEAAFSSQFPYKNCRALLVFQSGEIEELKYAAVHDPCRISFFYRNSLMVLVGGEEMDKGDFSRSIGMITTAKGERKTCTIITVQNIDISKDCFAVFQKLYRMLREQTIPGRLVIKRNFDWSETQRTCYQDEGLLKNIENQLSAKEWRTLLKRVGELFAVWEKEQCDLYHIKNAIHQITDRMYRTDSFEQSKLVINEYLDDCIRYADTYDKMRDMVCGCLEKVIKNRDYSQQEGKNADHICAEICRYVLENENKDFSLNEICYMFKVSQPFIRKAFRMNTGKSYNEWLLDTKIERAKELLCANSKLRVKDVAAQLGYEQLYFSTVFNKHVGMSHSEYKIHLQEEEGNDP